MFDKLHTYPKYFIFLIVVSLLITIPTFASLPKTPTKNQNSQTKNSQDPDLAKAYKVWTEYYQALQKGENQPLPVFTPPYDDLEKSQRAALMWDSGKYNAYRDLTLKTKQPKKAQQTQSLKTFNAEVAYKIWTEYYQAREKGENPPLPNFKPLNAPQEEANKLIAIWSQGKDRAYNQYIRRADQKDNYDRMKNILKNVGLESTVTLPTNFTSPTYDANGNMTSANGGTYSYDFKHRLIGITGNNLNISLVYNGDGDLVRKTVNGITTDYLVDSNNITGLHQVVEEIQNGQVIKQYTHGADGLISQRQLINGERVTSFYGKDGHGSVRYLTDPNGNITDTYNYDAFGNLINQTGNTPNNYLYAGERFDSDIGFYYLRDRLLNAATGRFLTQDNFEGDIEQPLSLHKYIYAHNNPINKLDPTGKFAIDAAINSSFRTTLAGGATFGNIRNVTNSIFNQDNPFPQLEGEHLLSVTEALFQSLAITSTKSSCDKALKKVEGHAGTSLYADIVVIANEQKIYDGTKTTAFSYIDKDLVKTVLDDFHKTVTFAMTPNRESDLKEKFTPPAIFVGQYFFTNLNRTEKTDLTFRSIILLHESVHYFGYRGHKKYGETQGLNQLIRDGCFPDYKSAALRIAQ